jgi:Domain of unknown function (DUF4430)
VRLRLAAAVLAAAALAGCGNGVGGGRATLWITRDRGAHVVKVTRVPAGLTAMQGLERVANVETRYGGRYVQAIDGLAGSLTAQRDWFYFVNGYEADRSAAEYRLRAGDVEWWDFRSWRDAMQVPVVVGAFPEPFVHGWNGHTRPTVVVYDRPELRTDAKQLARVVRAATVVGSSTKPMSGANVLELRTGRRAMWVADRGTGRPGDAIRMIVSGLAADLAANPTLARFRYAVLP